MRLWSAPYWRDAQLKRRAGRRCNPAEIAGSVRTANFNEGCCRVSLPPCWESCSLPRWWNVSYRREIFKLTHGAAGCGMDVNLAVSKNDPASPQDTCCLRAWNRTKEATRMIRVCSIYMLLPKHKVEDLIWIWIVTFLADKINTWRGIVAKVSNWLLLPC